MTKISAVIPAHDEENSIGNVISGCKQYCYEAIVIDDASTDGTSRVSETYGAIVVRNKTNLGVLRSTEIGLRLTSGEVVVTLDADGEHDPSDIPNIVQPIIDGKADLVMGRRAMIASPSERLIAKLVNFRVECADVGTGYRAFRGDLARKIRLWGICPCGSIVLEAHRMGARIVEVPISTGRRKFGKSHWSAPFSRGIMHLKQAIIVLWNLLH